MKPAEYSPKDAVGDLSGQVWFVTGGTGGLGRGLITTIGAGAKPPAHIYFTGRNQKAAEEVIQQYRSTLSQNPSSSTLQSEITFLSADLNSLASVKAATQAFVDKQKEADGRVRLDRLVCNAGIMAVPAAQTKDGYEIQFGVNHMAHSLFTKLLLPYIESTPDSRIVNVTSLGHTMSSGISFDTLKTNQSSWIPGYSWMRYGQSKLANVLYAKQLAVHYPNITSVSIHPGVIMTDLVNGIGVTQRLFIKATTVGMVLPIEDGVKNHVWASTVNKVELENGQYYEPVGVLGGTTKASLDVKLAEELWEWTEKELEGWELERK